MLISEVQINRGPGPNRKLQRMPSNASRRRANSLTNNLGRKRSTSLSLQRFQTEEGPPSHYQKHLKTNDTQKRWSHSQQNLSIKHKIVPIKRKAFIVVMGAIGSGKTSFVNLVTGSDLEVSGSLKCCTQMVALGSKLEFGGYEVNLIDTPGFGDMERSEPETLTIIAKYLQTLHQEGIKLHGVIFLWRIVDLRMSGTTRRSLQLLKEICGEKALQNSMIVTTMWDEQVPRDGDEREKQLKEEFLKSLFSEKVKMYRHNQGVESAWHIISVMLRNTPCPLAIQTEMANAYKSLLETGAGLYLGREIQTKVQYIINQVAVLGGTGQNTASSGETYVGYDGEHERQELLKQLTYYQREMKRLEEYYGEGHCNDRTLHQFGEDIMQIFSRLRLRWLRRFRKNGRIFE